MPGGELEELAQARADHATLTAQQRESAENLDRLCAQAAATWSYRDIARALGCSHSEVERRVHAHRDRVGRQS